MSTGTIVETSSMRILSRSRARLNIAIGPYGVGKTTIFKEIYSKSDGAVYIDLRSSSLDTVLPKVDANVLLIDNVEPLQKYSDTLLSVVPTLLQQNVSKIYIATSSRDIIQLFSKHITRDALVEHVSFSAQNLANLMNCRTKECLKLAARLERYRVTPLLLRVGEKNGDVETLAAIYNTIVSSSMWPIHLSRRMNIHISIPSILDRIINDISVRLSVRLPDYEPRIHVFATSHYATLTSSQNGTTILITAYLTPRARPNKPLADLVAKRLGKRYKQIKPLVIANEGAYIPGSLKISREALFYLVATEAGYDVEEYMEAYDIFLDLVEHTVRSMT